MEQTKYVNMLEEAAESLYQKNGARITADRYEGLCLKLLDLKKIPETEKVVYASGTAARKCAGSVYLPVKTVFHNGGKREILRSFAGTERV